MIVRIPQIIRNPYIDGREYNGKWKWLGRWLYEKLSRLRTCYRDSYRTVDIDVDNVVEAIYTQKNAISMIWHREVEMIIVGPDACRNLLATLFPEFHISNGWKTLTFRGIPVRLVPWASGILCVPKDK